MHHKIARHMATIVSCLTLMLVSVAAAGISAAPASANKSDCPEGYLCLWAGSTYGGERAQFHDNGWQNLVEFGFNNIAESYFNNTNRIASIASEANGGGKKFCIDPGGAATLGGEWARNASSVWLSPTSCG